MIVLVMFSLGQWGLLGSLRTLLVAVLIIPSEGFLCWNGGSLGLGMVSRYISGERILQTLPWSGARVLALTLGRLGFSCMV